MCVAILLRLCKFSIICVFFFKQKTAYEMRISDWSSDVCSSDLCPVWHCRWTQSRALPHLRRKRACPARSADARRDGRRCCHPQSADLAGFGRRARCEAGEWEDQRRVPQIGRASCRERVWQYVEIAECAGTLKKKRKENTKY